MGKQTAQFAFFSDDEDNDSKAVTMKDDILTAVTDFNPKPGRSFIIIWFHEIFYSWVCFENKPTLLVWYYASIYIYTNTGYLFIRFEN